MSLSRIYKTTTELPTMVYKVQLDQVNGLTGSRSIISAEVAAPAGAGEPIPAPGLTIREPKPPVQDHAELDARLKQLTEAQARFNQAAQGLAMALDEIAGLRSSLLAGSTDDMVRLVLAVAEQVVQNELRTDPEVIVRIISAALNAAIKSDMFHVRVNPEDFELVNERKPLFLASLSGLKNISFEADPQITRGGCLVESELGQVDATLEARLAEIRQQLLNSAPVCHAPTG